MKPVVVEKSKNFENKNKQVLSFSFFDYKDITQRDVTDK